VERFSRRYPGSGELRRLFIVAIVCTVVTGCGYRHVGYDEGRLTSGGKKVGITLFANKSYRTNLEATLSASLVDEFARRSGGKAVSEADAELLLSGTIDSYTEVPVSYTAFDVIKEYRAAMTVKATLRDKASQKVLWKGEVSETQTFPSFADASPLLTNVPLQQNIGPFDQNTITLLQGSETAAIREMCRKLAQRLYEKLSEDF
jgi:outer membrane lipopolysaccharide assembly protein LptE/RlpB